MEISPWIFDSWLVDDFKGAPEADEGLFHYKRAHNHENYTLAKKLMSFWFDDKTGNRTSTAADQNTRH